MLWPTILDSARKRSVCIPVHVNWSIYLSFTQLLFSIKCMNITAAELEVMFPSINRGSQHASWDTTTQSLGHDFFNHVVK